MRLRRFRLPAFSSLVAALSRRRSPRDGASQRRTRIVLPAVLVGIVAAVLPAGLLAARPGLEVHGLRQHAAVGAEKLANLRVRITAQGAAPEEVGVLVDGKPVEPERSPGGLAVSLDRLSDGEHTLTVAAGAAFGLARARQTRTFTVDTQAPEFDVPEQVWASSFTEPITVEGTVNGAERVSAGGDAVRVRDGAFDVRVANPPETLRLTATDPAGNTTRTAVRVGVEHPGMRAVHMSAISWSADGLREPIMDMIRQGKIDTVQLDIKDESGHVGYDSEVALANKIDADKGYYDAEKVVAKLHDMGVRVVGRLVCFHDPVLAEAAWKSGNRERVVQTPGGGAYSGGYGEYAFTNFANETVREYNLELAVEAAKLGFDGILFDYIRRPDGNRDNMVFSGLGEETTPSESVTGFVEKSAAEIHEAGAFVGVSVFGVAATRPKSVAQDISAMAEHADYIAPMVYPSHWGPGEYGVADPNNQPYDIVERSLRDFQKEVEDTGAVVIPWLQDFSLGVTYGPDEVRAQIEAAHDVGIDSFLLWDPNVSYTAAALNSPD